MKTKLLLLSLLTIGTLAACGKTEEKIISVAASEEPHAEVLKSSAVQDFVKAKGYKLSVTVLDWTLQNDAVAKGDYDANYFQHRPYLLTFNENYEKVFPVNTVHFEPLRVYPGKSTAADFESKKTEATFVICADISNEIRALDLLVACGALDGYDLDTDGVPCNLPSRISLIDESLLVQARADADYAVIPCNTALTGHLTADTTLPVETDEVADLRANVLAANTSKYKIDVEYKGKIDVLADALLAKSTADFITTKYSGIIKVYQKDLR